MQKEYPTSTKTENLIERVTHAIADLVYIACVTRCTPPAHSLYMTHSLYAPHTDE
jgi:hypothetical protein